MLQTITVPFTAYGKRGFIEATCEENPGPEVSGFTLLKDAVNFDVELCKGYPMFRARMTEYEGSHYGRFVGWIQIITGCWYPQEGECQIEQEVDLLPREREVGYPFICYGMPADIFDAPCHNLEDSGVLNWSAETFMVTYPSRMNDEEIRFLAGVRWGYDEDESGCTLVHPLVPLNGSDWNEKLPILRRDFPGWNYAEAE